MLVVVVIRLLAASSGSGRPSVIRYSTCAPIVYLASPLFDDLARVALRHKEDTVTRSTTLESRSVRHRKSKCLPVLLYGLEACPLTKTHLQSLDFVINRFFNEIIRNE